MSFATQKAAIVRWLELSSGLRPGKVIWTDQNMPRPVRPYISVNMTGFKTINREYIGGVDIYGAAKVIEHKEFTLPITYFESNVGVNDSIEVLSKVQSSVHTQQIQDLFTAQGIVFVRVLMGPDCVSAVVDAMSEQRSYMDLQFRMPWETSDTQQGQIDKVSTSGSLINIGGNTVEAMTFDTGTEYEPPETTITGYEFKSIDTYLASITVQSGTTILELFYNELTTVTLDGDPAVIGDLELDDVLKVIYFMYNGKKTIKSIEAIRP